MAREVVITQGVAYDGIFPSGLASLHENFQGAVNESWRFAPSILCWSFLGCPGVLRLDFSWSAENWCYP
jgi:hypothetical protein